MPPQSWGRRGVLAPELSLNELVTRSVAEVLAPLGGDARTSWQQRLRPVARLVPAVRRWMAHRLAIEARFDFEVMSRTEAVAARAGVDRRGFSPDALVALRGLAEETRTARPGAGGIPGFRGPESLYE